MTGSAKQPDAATTTTRDELALLRELLFGDEKDQLQQIQEWIDDPQLDANQVAHVLAEAVRLRSTQDDQLGQALGPTIVGALHASIKQEPRPLVDAIAPVMGPAIRRSISQTIRSMVQSLNRTLEHAFSWQGLKWRLEALRTGKPFAEVVLLHTLLYEVEQVFLIHRETGLLLQHVHLESTAVQDTDMVSGMLTAIQDFVKQTFGGDDDDSLHTMQVGDRAVWIEQGAEAVLAVVIRGEPGLQLRPAVQESLERVQLEHRKELVAFAGDTAPFEAAREHLERCLQVQYREPQKKQSPAKAVAMIALVAIALVAASGYWIFLGVRQRHRWQDYLARLRAEPGLIVTRAEKLRGRYHVGGLRDPLARSPSEILVETDFDPHDIAAETWEIYHSSHASLVKQRLRTVLAPPRNVKLDLVDGVVSITGAADGDWLAAAERFARSQPGVTGVDTAAVVNLDSDPAWEQLVERLRQEPGFVVTLAEKRDNHYFLGGLRDPLARTLQQIIEGSPLAATEITAQWKSYESSAERFVLQRARRLLQPPDGVVLKLDNNVLRASGAASPEWTMRAGLWTGGLTGVERIDFSEVKEQPHPDRAWHQLLTRLRTEPGFVITEVGQRDDKYLVAGLRDPLARPLDQLVAGSNLSVDRIVADWKPYHSLDQQFVLARVRRLLDPPDGVHIRVEQQVLYLEGAASHAWIRHILPMVRLVPGIERVDVDALIDTDQRRFSDTAAQIERLSLHFAGGTSQLIDSDDAVQQVADRLKQWFAAARVTDQQVRIRIVGHAANQGSAPAILQLSRERAEVVRARLVALSVPAAQLLNKGAGASEALPGDSPAVQAANRRVTFELINESEP